MTTIPTRFSNRGPFTNNGPINEHRRRALPTKSWQEIRTLAASTELLYRKAALSQGRAKLIESLRQHGMKFRGGEVHDAVKRWFAVHNGPSRQLVALLDMIQLRNRSEYDCYDPSADEAMAAIAAVEEFVTGRTLVNAIPVAPPRPQPPSRPAATIRRVAEE